MIRVALIGAGKMGISHLSILGAHPQVEVVGVADNAHLVTDFLEKYAQYRCFADYNKMIEVTKPDAVVVAVPTKLHSLFVWNLLKNDIHVFVEKPFCLEVDEGLGLIEMARTRNLVNQVGYHNKFIGTFTEAKKIIDTGLIGKIQHFTADMNGPVFVRSKQQNWRSKEDEGGGCLLDYAAHSIDLINYLVAPIDKVHGSMLKQYYNANVEDGVYALLETKNHISGVLNVNWSDETYRKMATTITIIGTKGKIIVDTTELKLYLKETPHQLKYSKGWNLRQINELSDEVDYYLRGEEYSAQLDYFIKAINGDVPNNINNFESANQTDRVIDLIRNFKTN